MSPTDTAALDLAEFRRHRELAETVARGVLGGVFYLAGWLVVGYFGGVHARQPLLALALSLLFFTLAALRVVLARTTRAMTVGARLRWWWVVFITTAVSWGALTIWVELDPHMQPARTAAAICTVAFATAYAHTFAMRPRGALLGIALLFLPCVLLTWILPGPPGVAISLTVYLVYLLSALRGSHAQYERHVALEWALSQQRDLYERQSRTDALTSLNNRREFAFTLDRLIVGESTLSLLMIDIDHFKRINDRYGHATGDAVLIAFADQLREHFAPSKAVLARLGGEEFAVLLPGVGEDAAVASAQQLCARLAHAPLEPGAERGAVTVSIGVGQRRANRHRSPDDFLADVDRSLYRAKAEGRNRVCRIF